ncbi:MAG TPA: hypothetical protein VII47_06720 [Actinomycetota bacterium]|jgi:hypothetical protein
MKNRTRFLLAGFALVVMTRWAGLAQAADPNAVVLPPDSHPYGMTYGQWSARWWQWAVSSPKSTNPVLDQTGAHCGVGQSGPVWYLAGTFGGPVTRSCTVPAGKALFFPVVNAFWANDPGGNLTYDDCLANARKAMTGATGSADIDGAAVEPANHLEQRYRFVSPSFSLVLEADNPFDAPPGTYAPAAADGIYLMVAPLDPGPHVVHFRGFAQGSPPDFPPTSVEATYNLTVANG